MRMPVYEREKDFSDIDILVGTQYTKVFISKSKTMNHHSFPHRRACSELPISSIANAQPRGFTCGCLFTSGKKILVTLIFLLVLNIRKFSFLKAKRWITMAFRIDERVRNCQSVVLSMHNQEHSHADACLRAWKRF